MKLAYPLLTSLLFILTNNWKGLMSEPVPKVAVIKDTRPFFSALWLTYFPQIVISRERDFGTISVLKVPAVIGGLRRLQVLV